MNWQNVANEILPKPLKDDEVYEGRGDREDEIYGGRLLCVPGCFNPLGSGYKLARCFASMYLPYSARTGPSSVGFFAGGTQYARSLKER